MSESEEPVTSVEDQQREVEKKVQDAFNKAIIKQQEKKIVLYEDIPIDDDAAYAAWNEKVNRIDSTINKIEKENRKRVRKASKRIHASTYIKIMVIWITLGSTTGTILSFAVHDYLIAKYGAFGGDLAYLVGMVINAVITTLSIIVTNYQKNIATLTGVTKEQMQQEQKEILAKARADSRESMNAAKKGADE